MLHTCWCHFCYGSRNIYLLLGPEIFWLSSSITQVFHLSLKLSFRFLLLMFLLLVISISEVLEWCSLQLLLFLWFISCRRGQVFWDLIIFRHPICFRQIQGVPKVPDTFSRHQKINIKFSKIAILSGVIARHSKFFHKYMTAKTSHNPEKSNVL